MLKLKVQYPGPNQTIINANWPEGGPNNSSIPGALDGTPEDQEWKRDIWGFLERLREVSGIIPSGAPDNALVSQRYDALKQISRDVFPVWEASHIYAKGAVTLASNDKTYQSLIAANLGNDPISSPSEWVEFNPVTVIDNLLSTSSTDALSSGQGKILKDLIDALTLLVDVATTTTRGTALLSQLKTIANNGVDPDNYIDFSAGRFDFADGSGQAIASAQTKYLNVVWGGGGNQGMLDSTSTPIAPSTWYALYDIYNTSTGESDKIASDNFTAPTLPGGSWTKYAYRAAIYRQSDNTNQKIRQYGKNFIYEEPVLSLTDATFSASQSLTVRTPLGHVTRALLNAYLIDNLGGGVAEVGVQSLWQPGTYRQLYGDVEDGGQFEIDTNLLSQIYLLYLNGPGNLQVHTMGYHDYRVKN